MHSFNVIRSNVGEHTFFRVNEINLRIVVQNENNAKIEPELFSNIGKLVGDVLTITNATYNQRTKKMANSARHRLKSNNISRRI